MKGEACPFCRGTGDASAIRFAPDPRPGPGLLMQPVYDPEGVGFYICLIQNGDRVGVTETRPTLDNAFGAALKIAGKLGARIVDSDPAFTVRGD